VNSLKDLSIGASEPHLVGLATYIYTDTDHGVHHEAPPLGFHPACLVYKQGHTPKDGTIQVDTDWMRKEAGAAFQIERPRLQTTRAILLSNPYYYKIRW